MYTSLQADPGRPGRRDWGQSKNGVLCDGSHQGLGVTPYILKLENAKTLHLCNCGKTGNKPFCDVSHVNL
jgi:CDGSH-type Zn-finger protein